MPASAVEPAPAPEARSPADSTAAQVPRSLRARLVALLSDYVLAQPPDSLQADLIPAEEAFQAYEGRTIRSIVIEQLDIFSGMPGAAGGRSHASLEQWARHLHRNTRASIIRQHLLVWEGDRLDPFTLADTERILRATGFLQDARIEVLPVPEQPDLVDLLVVTRDLWSIGFSLPLDRVDELRLKLYQRNVLGYGHEFQYRLRIETSAWSRSQWEARYRVGNILGRFLRAELALGDSQEERWQRTSLGRSPIAPQIRLAGAAGIEHVALKDAEDLYPDRYREKSIRLDGWLGYNFPLGRNEAGGPGRTSLFPALRATWTDYSLCPPDVSPDDLEHQDRVLVLGGLQLARNAYRTTRLVYAYGETEDIAVGYRVGVAAGMEFGCRADRPYAAVAAGGFGDLGLPWLVGGGTALGAYRRNGRSEDGVIDTRLHGFSQLRHAGSFRLRQFASLRHTAGIHRLAESDQLVLDHKTGVRGLRDSGLGDRQRAVCNLESVAFTPWAPLGFKIAAYGFCDIGAVAHDLSGFLTARYYESLGLGLRLRNERLVFDTIDLQLAFLPSPPEGSDPQWVRFRDPPSVPTDPWLVGPPGQVEYR